MPSRPAGLLCDLPFFEPGPFGQDLAMRLEKRVHELPYLVQIEFGCRVGVHHGGVINMLALLLDKCPNRQFLNVDVGAHQRGQLRGQLSDRCGLDARGIDKAWNFGRACVGQRGDRTIVAHISVDHGGCAGPDRIDDLGGIFVAWLDLDGIGVAVLFGLALPALNLLDAALGVFIKGNTEFLDKVLATFLDK